ncbi:hypothetical protein SynROS8604_02770 [Synechococcus sp. ROS8604]|nr:hypothetical protein SynROS8604_02770 [Synechococcus sp. ROS8604]
MGKKQLLEVFPLQKIPNYRSAISIADTLVLAISFYLLSAQSCQVLDGI